MKEAKIQKLTTTAVIPTRGSIKAAGYDLYCDDEWVEIRPGTCAKIHTGLAITPPEGYFGAVAARSGLATKQGLRPANCIGVCDEDYTGEYIVALYNDSSEIQTVARGERIAQLIFLPYEDITFVRVDKLNETQRGAGGFGSTGNK